MLTTTRGLRNRTPTHSQPEQQQNQTRAGLAIVFDRAEAAILGTTRWSTGNGSDDDGGPSECDGQMNLGNGLTKKWRTEGQGRGSE